MSRLRQIGITMVILALGGVLAWSIRLRWVHGRDADTVLRIAHMNAYPTVVAGFDRVAREYESRHPGVRIEQILIPQRAYPAWLRTRLVGGVAPDIVELEGRLTDEDYARFFRDLTGELLAPNPYNRGTAFADTRWRDTFVTGIQERPSYVESLLSYYSVPGSLITYRLIYNRDLLEKTFNQSTLPRTALELAQLCHEIAQRSRAEGLGIIPIATESENGRTTLEGVLRAETQELLLQLDPYGQYWCWDDEVAIGYLLGRWSLHTPIVLNGLAAMGALGRELPPGFLQMGKGEGTFLFLQGKAVFLLAPSFEYTMFRASCDFPIGVMRAPAAASDPSRINTEGNVLPVANLGIVNSAQDPARALDFLQFFASQEGNRLFADASLWLPAIRGIEPQPELAVFAPQIVGRPPGLSLWLFSKADYYSVSQHLHLLTGQQGSTEKFVAALEPAYGATLRNGLHRRAAIARKVGQRLDTALGALDRLTAAGVDASSPQRNAARIIETQAYSEARASYYALAHIDSADDEIEFFSVPPLSPPPVPGSP